MADTIPSCSIRRGPNCRAIKVYYPSQSRQLVGKLGFRKTLSRVSQFAVACLIAFPCYADQRAKTLEQPTDFYVIENDTPVHCGPGNEYYPTQLVDEGVQVQVHIQTNDGWSAIRPTESSFSWVAAEHVYLLPDGETLEVTSSQAPSWIGSSIGTPKKYLWQMHLPATQQLKTIGRAEQRVDGGSPRLWFKIAPPSGEFRWIRTNDLSSQPPLPSLNDGPLESRTQSVTRASSESDRYADSPKERSLVVNASATQSDDDVVQTAQYFESSESTIEGFDHEPNIGEVPIDLQDGQILVGQPYFEGEAAQSFQPQGEADYYVAQQPAYSDGANYYEEDIELGPGEFVVGPSGTRDLGSAHHGPPGVQRRQPRRPAREPYNAPENPLFRNHTAIDNSRPGMRVRPLGSILGVLGFAVREVDVVPPNQLRDPSALGEYESGTGSRLDRLPRPGRRNTDYLGSANGRSGQDLGQLREEIGSEMERLVERLNDLSKGPDQAPFRSESSQLREELSLLVDELEKERGSSSLRSAEPPSLRTPTQSGSSNSDASTPTWHARVSDRDLTALPLRSLSPSMMASNSDTASSPPNFAARDFSTPPSDGLSREVQAIQIELQKILSGVPSNQDFQTIAEYANYLIDHGETPIVRGEARILLDRIRQLEIERQDALVNAASQRPQNALDASFVSSSVQPASSIRSLSQLTGNALSNAWQASESAVQRSLSAASPTEISSHEATTSDASGWLMPVLGANPTQPQYALTDDSGKIISYVSPAPGMNLELYSKQPVAIYGTRGFYPALSARHISADRVVRIR